MKMGTIASPWSYDDAAIRALQGARSAILLEQNDEWVVQHWCWMTLETIAPLGDDPIVGFPAVSD